MSTGVLLLLGASFALLAGPLAFRYTESSSKLRSFVDGLAIVAVGGFALFELAPSAFERGGLGALLSFGVGLSLPMLLHRFGQSSGFSDHVLIIALALHNAVEAAALANAGPEAQVPLGLAIIVHGLPLGLAAFAVTDSHRAGWTAVAFLVAGTLLGYGGGEAASELLSSDAAAWLQAWAAGSLLHVLSGHEYEHHAQFLKDHASPAEAALAAHHANPENDGNGGHDTARLGRHSPEPHHGHAHGEAHHRRDPAPPEIPLWGTLGGAVGFLLFFSSAHTNASHEGDHDHFTDTILRLALAVAPALLCVAVLAGAAHLLLPKPSRHRRANPTFLDRPFREMSLGLLSPFGRQVTSPRRVIQFVASSALGLEAIFVSISLLGGTLSSIRLAASALLALLAGLVVESVRARDSTPHSNTSDDLHHSPTLGATASTSLLDRFDHAVAWMLVGLLIASLTEPLFAPLRASSLPGWLFVPIFAVFGLPLSLSAAGATPIAAVAIQSAISPGSALALLLVAPTTNFRTLGNIRRTLGARATTMYALTLFFLAICVGYTTDALLTPSVSHLNPDASLVEIVCLSVLGLLALFSLFRRGPRGMLNHVTRSSPVEA